MQACKKWACFFDITGLYLLFIAHLCEKITRQSLQAIYQRKTQVRQKLSLAEAEDITTAII